MQSQLIFSGGCLSTVGFNNAGTTTSQVVWLKNTIVLCMMSQDQPYRWCWRCLRMNCFQHLCDVSQYQTLDGSIVQWLDNCMSSRQHTLWPSSGPVCDACWFWRRPQEGCNVHERVSYCPTIGNEHTFLLTLQPTWGPLEDQAKTSSRPKHQKQGVLTTHAIVW